MAREFVEVVITASFAGASRTAGLTIRAAASSPLLKVRGVRILNTGRQPDNPNPDELAQMREPGTPLRAVRANAIEVDFTGARVDFDTVIAGKTFIVADERDPDRSLPGVIVPLPARNHVRWVFMADTLPAGSYRVTLKGEGDVAIRSREGLGLDGEPQQLPSGNDEEGRDFFFRLRVDAG